MLRFQITRSAAASPKLGYKGCMPVKFAEKWQADQADVNGRRTSVLRQKF